jgi:adenine-specific DNA-methyltransferase
MEKTKALIGERGTVADVMAGTGIVAFEYKKAGYTVIASDMMTYSYHHLVTNLLLDEPPAFLGLKGALSKQEPSYLSVLEHLNRLSKVKSFFYNEFSPQGKPSSGLEPRRYFTSENAGRIDAIREQINSWIEADMVTSNEASLLKHTLIMAVNRVANISGTYGYFLAEIKKNALEPLELLPVVFESGTTSGHKVLLGFAEDLASSITADLCYLDPPYMKRQYAANYHILETIARGDFPDAIGKSGLRDWWDQHSKFCTKTRGLDSFSKVIGEMECDIFLISYSEDGLFTLEQIIACFEAFGKVGVQKIDYNRFRSNDSPLPKKLQEYLITLTK